MKKECTAIMLPSEEATGLSLGRGGSFLAETHKTSKAGSPQVIHIFSEEPVRVGDYYYFTWSGAKDVHKCHSQNEADECNGKIRTDINIDGCSKRIIASSEKELIEDGVPSFSDDFVGVYRKAFNSGNPITEVKVEYSPTDNTLSVFAPKIGRDGNIRIHQSEVFTKKDLKKPILDRKNQLKSELRDLKNHKMDKTINHIKISEIETRINELENLESLI